MNILVCVKQVADTEARILLTSDKKSIEIENKYNMNFFDEFAVEEAIRTKGKVKDCQISVCTYGSNKATEVLSCLLYTSPSPRYRTRSRMPSSA